MHDQRVDEVREAVRQTYAQVAKTAGGCCGKPVVQPTAAQALGYARQDVDTVPEALKVKLDDYQVVVLNNWNIQALPEARKQEFEEYVKQGGGLLVIGGERNIYIDPKRTEEDPLERALPARITPPKSPEVRCVVLLIDKSSSMEGRKIELARL